MIPDNEEDIDEHVILSQSKTDVVFDTVGGEMIVDLSEIWNAINEEDKEEVNESEDTKPTREELKKGWFRKVEKVKDLSFKDSIDVSGNKELKRGIISWFFDSELKLFVIKRFDGLQYLKNNLKTFSSLPKYEIKELAWKVMAHII